MMLDNDVLFSNAQAITATAASTNVIDLRPLGGATANTGRALGQGSPMYIFVSVDVAFTDAGSDSTLTVTLETDDNAAFSSAQTVATLVILPALSAAGTKRFFPMPFEAAVPYEAFIRLNYTTTGGNLTTGSLTAGIILNVDLWQSYQGGFVTGT